MDLIGSITVAGVEFLSTLFIFVVGISTLAVFGMWIADANQSRDAVRHNFPVIGRFRYLFSRLGEFFRQYFFALDREELPFNRAQREWINGSAKGTGNTTPFGSTLDLTRIGTPIFINCAFPKLDEEATDPPARTFGPYTENPYTASSLINISGMSFGAISRPAVLAFSRGARLAGCWLNTGEGGLSDYHLEGGCDIVFQIGTAKYGVRDKDGGLDEKLLAKVAAHEHVKMIEIKLAQGAKPGKGGILPAEKVTKAIARIRGIEPHTASISPNRHGEIDSIEELLDFVDRVRRIAKKPVGFKTVVGAYGWLDELCEAVKRRGIESAPDFITVDGGDGGTGAAPLALVDNVGLPLRQALPMVSHILTRGGLKGRMLIIASGKLVTPAEVAWAYCAGADFVNSARGFMFSIGCIQALRCHTNTCPTGITTHKKHLQGGLNPGKKSVHVKNYVEAMRKEVAMIAHSCGAAHARALRPMHVRMVAADGRSIPLDQIPPLPQEQNYFEPAE